MMPDREKYIEILSKAAKTVKEFNVDTPIKISLECIEDILELLKEQEAVVHCKDCKYGDWTKNMRNEDMIFCYNGDTGIEDGYLHEPDWFCAEGEMRI